MTSLRTELLQDWKCNTGRPSIQILLLLLRMAQVSRRRTRSRALTRLTSAAYRSYALTVASVDIPVSTRIGPGLRIHHGFGLVIHDRTVIGGDVTLRHGTTFGTRASGAIDAPEVGDRVDIGASALVIGPVRLGDDCKVGAGSVVVHDVPPGLVVAGNPARPLTPPGRVANKNA